MSTTPSPTTEQLIDLGYPAARAAFIVDLDCRAKSTADVLVGYARTDARGETAHDAEAAMILTALRDDPDLSSMLISELVFRLALAANEADV